MEESEDKTTSDPEKLADDKERDFEDIQLDVDTDIAKYIPEKDSEHSKENGKPSENVITEQPIDARPPPSYAIDVIGQSIDPPVVRQGPLKPMLKDFVLTSCFVILCCNFIFGLLGYHFGGKNKFQLNHIHVVHFFVKRNFSQHNINFSPRQ